VALQVATSLVAKEKEGETASRRLVGEVASFTYPRPLQSLYQDGRERQAPFPLAPSIVGRLLP
jgi:hypothetical protein